jgi:3D (Asp-Asp-Asp) domain-containing protein
MSCKYFKKIIVIFTALCFLLSMAAADIAFAAGIKALSETLDQSTAAAENNAAVNNSDSSGNLSSSATGSFFSKIGGFFKNIFSGFKNFCSKSSGKQSFFGKLFDSILSLFGICNNKSNSSAAADSNNDYNSSAAAGDNQSSSGSPSSGTLSNGETVQILEQSSGSYKIKKENGDISWICKKKIRTKQTGTSQQTAGNSNSDQTSSSSTSSSTSTSSAASSSSSSSPASSQNGDTSRGTGRTLSGVKATGYYPPPPGGYKTKAEAAMEGGALDCRGNKLRTLQNYKPGSYVSCATDPRVIKTGTYFTIDEFPGVKFLACDVGGAIKGNHIDICCNNAAETYKLPSKITIRYL